MMENGKGSLMSVGHKCESGPTPHSSPDAHGYAHVAAATIYYFYMQSISACFACSNFIFINKFILLKHE